MVLAYRVHTNVVKLVLGLNSALCIELPIYLSSAWYLGVVTDFYLFGIIGRISSFFSSLLLSFVLLFCVLLATSVVYHKKETHKVEHRSGPYESIVLNQSH